MYCEKYVEMGRKIRYYRIMHFDKSRHMEINNDYKKFVVLIMF